MEKKYIIEYNIDGETYITMDGICYFLNDYIYDRYNNILTIDYVGQFKVDFEYDIDDYRTRIAYPETLRFEVENVDVMITHIGGYPGRYDQAIRSKLLTNPPKLFIAGHSHILKVMYDEKLKTLHMNPGAAGIYGFHKVRTLLRFILDNGNIKDLEVIELGNRG